MEISRQQQERRQVGVDQMRDLLVAVAVDRAADVRSYVVDENVELRNGVDDDGAACLRRDVRRKATYGAMGRKGRRRQLDLGGVPRAEHDLRTESKELLDDGAANAFRSTGDEGA